MKQTYSNAAGGLRLLFFGQLVILIAALAAGIGAGMAVVGYMEMSRAMMGSGALLALIAALGIIVGYVMEVLGLYRAGADDPDYRSAMAISLVALGVSALNLYLFSDILVLSKLASAVTAVLDFLVVRGVCQTTGKLLQTAGEDALAGRGAAVEKIYFVCTAISVVCTIVGIIPGLVALAGLVSGLAGIAQLVGCVMFLMFLNGSSKAL